LGKLAQPNGSERLPEQLLLGRVHTLSAFDPSGVANRFTVPEMGGGLSTEKAEPKGSAFWKSF
jgi:hypothetical protein